MRRLRAVIFDVYQTILDVGPPPHDAEGRWRWLWQGAFDTRVRLELGEFRAACNAVIQREHALAQGRGISFPEVYWPAVLSEVVPEIRPLWREQREAFELALARLDRTVTLMPGAVPVLRLLLASGVVVGIASNAQPYTLRELDDALSAVGLALNVFQSDLTFWSFQHGFSKPDPHVFQLLTARLRNRGFSSGETLMVGDRLDHDVTPAAACSWRTFQLLREPSTAPGLGGDWQALARWLDGRLFE